MSPSKVRIDKWLWSVRIFKSRTIATDACKSSKVKIQSVPVKPSHLLQGEEIIEVRKDGFNLQFKVVNLIEKRVGAPVAQTCYIDLTPEEERNKYKEWYVGKAAAERREKGAGRPTKKDRRFIEKFKGEEEV
jgi:ribosome-associated heat shock protein Hsp15